MKTRSWPAKGASVAEQMTRQRTVGREVELGQDAAPGEGCSEPVGQHVGQEGGDDADLERRSADPARLQRLSNAPSDRLQLVGSAASPTEGRADVLQIASPSSAVIARPG